MNKTLLATAGIAVAVLLGTTVITGIAVGNTVTAQADRIVRATADDRTLIEVPSSTSVLRAKAGDDLLVVGFTTAITYDFVQVLHDPTEAGGFTAAVIDQGVALRVDPETPVGTYKVILEMSPSEIQTPLIFVVEVIE